MTRRRMAALLGSAPVLATAVAAQQEENSGRLEEARNQIEEALATMEEFDLPMAAEPAFVFKP